MGRPDRNIVTSVDENAKVGCQQVRNPTPDHLKRRQAKLTGKRLDCRAVEVLRQDFLRVFRLGGHDAVCLHVEMAGDMLGMCLSRLKTLHGQKPLPDQLAHLFRRIVGKLLQDRNIGRVVAVKLPPPPMVSSNR